MENLGTNSLGSFNFAIAVNFNEPAKMNWTSFGFPMNL